jgi:hypothetical protein
MFSPRSSNVLNTAAKSMRWATALTTLMLLVEDGFSPAFTYRGVKNAAVRRTAEKPVSQPEEPSADADNAAR